MAQVPSEATNGGDLPAAVDNSSETATDTATPTPTQTPTEAPTPPNFQLTDLQPTDATVTEGEFDHQLLFTVTNQGEAAGTQTIEYAIFDEQGVKVRSTQVAATELAGGESKEIYFSGGVEWEPLDPGEYTFAVLSENDEATGSLTIQPAGTADFQLTDLTPTDATVTAGDFDLQAMVTVTNQGDASGTQDVEFVVIDEEGETVRSHVIVDVELAAGDSEDFFFAGDQSWEPLGPGEYTIGFESENDTATGSLTVKPAETRTETDTAEPTDTQTPTETSTETETISATETPTGTQTAEPTDGGTEADETTHSQTDTPTEEDTPANPTEPDAGERVDVTIDLGEFGFSSADGAPLRISISFGEEIDMDFDFAG